MWEVFTKGGPSGDSRGNDVAMPMWDIFKKGCP